MEKIRTQLINSGFTQDQIEEIKTGFDEGLDITAYADKEFLAIQMRQIRFGLESGQHIERVKGYTKLLAEQLMKDYPEYGLTSDKVSVITSASALHDIGKIAIPDAILMKPGKLTQEEFEYMKSHTTKGGEILNSIKNVWDEEYGKVSYEICRHHHERYDGRGYPDGLKGEQIPLSAQIVSIADVYDALVNERVYKSAFPKEKAFQMIVTGECGVFSPKLLDCFWNARRAFERLADG